MSVIAITVLGILPGVVSAHGGEHTPSIPQWYGLVVLLLGFGVLGGSVVANRQRWVASTERALAGMLFGIIVAAIGGILLVELSRTQPAVSCFLERGSSPWRWDSASY